MSCESIIIASNTEPVREVINDKKNGLLVDFFDVEDISEKVIDVLSNPKKYNDIRKMARKTIIDNYDLRRVCLPKQMKLIEGLLE